MIFLTAGKLNEMSSVVLYNCGLCYFLDFDDIELCVLAGLTPEAGLHSLAELGLYQIS